MSIYKELSYDQEIDAVKGIQFSVLSPEEIIRGSVLEVTKTDTYAGNEPVPSGLFDPRMGVLEHNAYCRTCEQKNIFCPGHFGHIVLARPVFHPLFFENTRKILKCVCFRCSRLLISPTESSDEYREQIRKIMLLKNLQKRWEMMFKLCNNANKIKRCGDDGAPGCGAKQPSRYVKEGTLKIFAEWKEPAVETVRKEFTAEDVLTIFQRIPESEMEVIGFNPKWNRPDWLISTVIPVPPPPVRPSIIEENGQRREDDLTHKLCDIIKTNNQLKSRLEKPNANEEHLAVITGALQYHYATFLDNQIPGLPPAQQRNGRKLKSVSDRLKKKEGRIRGNLNGKRVDQSARSVITPDPYISLDELGVPVKIAMNLTFPEVVNSYNIDEMRRLVKNGPNEWPGAKDVRKKEDGKTYTLKYGNREKIAEDLVEGDVVDRHLRDGDYVLFNRQPSLHKMSMMSHRVKVMPYQTFRLNVLVTSPYNADFDGDEMNLHAPQSIQTMCELKDFANVPYHIIGPKDGKPIIEVVQDTMVGSFRLTKDHVRIHDKAFANLQMVNSYFDGILPEPEDKKTREYTGRQASSHIMPPGLHLTIKNRLKEVVSIQNRKHVSGILDKNVFHSMSQGILPVIYHDYNPFEVRRFLDNLQRLVCRWLLTSGFSVGISDLVVDKGTKEILKDIIVKMKSKAYEELQKVRNEKQENNSIMNNKDYFEQSMINILNGATSSIEKNGLENVHHMVNRMINMVQSGSKGKPTNVAQMIACVGQQNVDGKRVAYGFTNRTLPHYNKFDDGPAARGFVENSFISGLTPQEMFFHAMGGREGLIDTAVKSVTGDTPIVVLEDGIPHYRMIGEWIDNYMEKYPKDIVVEEDRPDLEFLKLEDKVEVYIPTGNEKGGVSWEKLTAVTRHDPTEVVYEVETSGGRKVTVADSESLLVWDSEKEEYLKKHSSLVQVGDCVPIVMNMATPPSITEYFDMSEFFQKTKYVYGTEFNTCVKMMKEAQGDKFHIPSGWYEENNGTTFTLPYTSKARVQRVVVRSNTENIQDGSIYPFHATREHSHLPEKFMLDYENGVFIGLYLADGCAHESSGTISITKDDPSVQDFVCKWFTKYGITYRVDTSKNEYGMSTSIIGSSTLFARFLQMFVGQGARVKHIPDVAYTAPDAFVKGLLSGYISGDGCICQGSVTTSSASRRLTEGVSFLLSRMGVFGKISVKQLKENNFHTMDIAPSYTLSVRSKWASILATTLELVHQPKNQLLKNMEFTKEHRNFKEMKDTVMDPIVKITKQCGTDTCVKMYDVTVPSTLNFVIANGMNCRDTSETGYIQRRLVKAMEDAKVHYDQTVRNAAGSIIQFMYGEDGMEGTKIEQQIVPHIDMDILGIRSSYHISEEDKMKMYLTDKAYKEHTKNKTWKKDMQEYLEQVVNDREFLIQKVFRGQQNNKIEYPIPFARILQNAVHRMKDMGLESIPSNMTPSYVLAELNKLIHGKESLHVIDEKQGTRFLHILLRAYLSPKQLICKYHLQQETFDFIISEVKRYFKEAIACAGEMVGIIAAQSLGEPATQLTLDSFHVSGTAAAVKATSGVPRLKELLSVSKNIKTPTLKIFLKPDISQTIDYTEDKEGKVNDPRVMEAKERVFKVLHQLEITRLFDLLESTEIYWDPPGTVGLQTSIETDNNILSIYREFAALEPDRCRSHSPWVLRMKLNKEKLKRVHLTMIDIYMKIYQNYGNTLDCVFSDDNDRELIFHMRLHENSLKDIDTEDMVAALKAIEYNIVHTILLKGVQKIKKVSMRQHNHVRYNMETQKFEKINEWIMDTDGSNMVEIMANPNIDPYRTVTNDIYEIYTVLGIEAARNALSNEIMEVIKESSVNLRHLYLLIDTMTCKGTLMSIDRHGINRGDVGPLAKSSFEETTDMLIKASVFSDVDRINGVSANIMLGQLPPCGTGDSEILLDEEEYINLIKDRVNYIQSYEAAPEIDPCSEEILKIMAPVLTKRTKQTKAPMQDIHVV